jgi:hypothetical protein
MQALWRGIEAAEILRAYDENYDLLNNRGAIELESVCFFCRVHIFVRQTPTVFRLSSVQIASLDVVMDDRERLCK